MWEYNAELQRVVEGDTMDFRVDLGFSVYKEIRVRLAGVDTNETYGVKKDSEEFALGKEQTQFVEQWFDEREGVIIRTSKDEKGKYGRYIARVFGDGDDLSKDLIDEWSHVESEY
jgi:micrococcal nuclease